MTADLSWMQAICNPHHTLDVEVERVVETVQEALRRKAQRAADALAAKRRAAATAIASIDKLVAKHGGEAALTARGIIVRGSAACGYMMVMADGGDFPPDPKAPTDEGMVKILDGLDGACVTVRLDDLRQWAGPTSEPCNKCGGKRVIKCSTCRGWGQHECMTCDAEHDCGHCDGTGKVECDCTPPVRPGRIGTLGIDRRRVACVVAHATDVTVEVLLDGDRLAIFGAGWMALVMSLRDVADDAPTFALDGKS